MIKSKWDVLEEVKKVVEKHKSNKWLWIPLALLVIGVFVFGLVWLLIKFLSLFRVSPNKNAGRFYLPKI